MNGVSKTQAKVSSNMITVDKLVKHLEKIRVNCAKRKNKDVYYEILNKSFSMYDNKTKQLIFTIGVDGSTYGEIDLLTPSEYDTIMTVLEKTYK